MSFHKGTMSKLGTELVYIKVYFNKKIDYVFIMSYIMSEFLNIITVTDNFLIEAIPRQDSIPTIVWLPTIALIQNYTDNEQTTRKCGFIKKVVRASLKLWTRRIR